ncbi:Dps family protein [Flavivirga sp. 57AJ16]|uniref:Dps family protein n=1 Tax=Flavivirga sp. 57AJ16 TaxID=3025307 RepID=UPI00236653E7|nr:DNA starvation/stationary phase protection protein [Flavivirga sp. 57AJ16]MDD7886624.1 DNA starvation/stationary phase protection protein [Flavivirga sp. 57AJ16]
MTIKIGLSKKDLERSIKNLTVVLSNKMILYVKLRKFHWNVSGNSFMELHKLFEDQYNNIEHSIDEVAERISKLGGKTIGTMKDFLEHTTLKESTKYESQENMLTELLSDHEAIITNTRKMIVNMEKDSEDFGTIDFLTSLMQLHESQAWMIRNYLS